MSVCEFWLQFSLTVAVLKNAGLEYTSSFLGLLKGDIWTDSLLCIKLICYPLERLMYKNGLFLLLLPDVITANRAKIPQLSKNNNLSSFPCPQIWKCIRPKPEESHFTNGSWETDSFKKILLKFRKLFLLHLWRWVSYRTSPSNLPGALKEVHTQIEVIGLRIKLVIF